VKPVANPSPPEVDGPEHQLGAIERLLSDTADFFEKALPAQARIRRIRQREQRPRPIRHSMTGRIASAICS
jgi:hypothetical protein